nr:diphosphomevalonate decarboxylase [Gardnerella vaginalis]
MENVEIEPKIAFNVLDDIDSFNNSNHGAAFTATANANIALIKYWGKRDE